MDNINSRVAQLRKTLGLTQAEFVEQIGTSRGVIANIELNRAPVSQIVFHSICRVFHVSPLWLKEGEGEMFVVEDEDDAVNQLMLGDNEFAKQVFRSLAKLSPESWELFRQFVDTLKKGDP